MSDLISDLKVINGGWRATLVDGSTLDVTDKEVTFAGCAQNAVSIKIRDQNLEPKLDAKQFENTGWQDGFYCGLRPVAYGDNFEALVDPGDLNQDPLPATRAAAGRATEIEGDVISAVNLRVLLGDEQIRGAVLYADAAKHYVVVLTEEHSAYTCARIDGLPIEIECTRPKRKIVGVHRINDGYRVVFDDGVELNLSDTACSRHGSAQNAATAVRRLADQNGVSLPVS